jgi:uncharacterized protein
MKTILIIFQKNSDKGKVKTRLAETLGDDKALAIYKQLTAYTHQIAQQLDCDKWLFYSERYETEFEKINNYTIRIQRGADLGERMRNAFSDVLSAGYERAVIIGTDCLQLQVELVQEAFHALELYDVVIGPADDGGYYLLGMKRLYASLFANKNWSTSTVAKDTFLDINHLGLQVYQLPSLGDIDTEADWNKYRDQIEPS